MWMDGFIFLPDYNFWHAYVKGYVLAILGWFKLISPFILGRVSSTQMSEWEGGKWYILGKRKTSLLIRAILQMKMDTYCVTWNLVPTLAYTSKSKTDYLSNKGCSECGFSFTGCVIIWEPALGRKLPVRRGAGNDRWGALDRACEHACLKSLTLRGWRKRLIKWPGSKVKRTDFDFSKSSEKRIVFIRV